MVAVDKESRIPIYLQLKELIKERILQGEYRPGQLIPSERELCMQYGISRMTARQAIGELQNEGYLYKLQGKGTFVSSGKIEQNLACLLYTSFIASSREGMVFCSLCTPIIGDG